MWSTETIWFVYLSREHLSGFLHQKLDKLILKVTFVK